MTFETAPAVVPAFETIRTITVTPRGAAVSAVYRLLATLRELGPDERGDIRELLEMELAEQLD